MVKNNLVKPLRIFKFGCISRPLCAYTRLHNYPKQILIKTLQSKRRASKPLLQQKLEKKVLRNLKNNL